jgi:hypothetical protein
MRIKKAMGYGLTFEDFHARTLLDIDRSAYLGDELEEKLPRPQHTIQYGGDDHLWRVIDNGWVVHMMPISDLIMSVGPHDTTTHILFFPNEKLKNKWFRFDDDLDWYAARAGNDDLPVSDIRFSDTPIHPFPETPDVLRWWLVHFGVLDNAGVDALRPMIAEWWG